MLKDGDVVYYKCLALIVIEAYVCIASLVTKDAVSLSGVGSRLPNLLPKGENLREFDMNTSYHDSILHLLLFSSFLFLQLSPFILSILFDNTTILLFNVDYKIYKPI